MADSETTVPADEQQAAEGTENTQQEAASGETNDASAPEGQGEATQEAGGEGAQEATADTEEPQESEEGGADAAGSGDDDAGTTEEQAAADDTATAEPQGEPESQQQEAAVEQDAEPEAEAATQQEAEPAEPEPEPAQEEAQQEAQAEESPAVELSDEDKAKYRRIFDRKAVDGRLDLKGFKVLFRLMGQVLSAQDAETMFDEGDRDDNGTVDFEEFCRLYAKFSEAEQTRKEGLMTSINKLFPNSDGEPVALRKVESLLLKLQQPNLDMRLVREKSDLNAGDVKSMVKSMDTNGDGYISKQEFVETLTKHLDMA